MSKLRVQGGLWPSELSPPYLARSLRLSDVQWDDQSGTLVWLEGRSDQGVLVALPAGELAPRDLTVARSVRAQVGYGGGEFAAAHGQVVFASGGRLYRQALAGGPEAPLTPAWGQAASPAVSPDGQWVLFVHHDGSEDRLAVVDAAGRCWPQVLAQGADFYMQPCWAPDGSRAAWVEWDQPHMPWDRARLVLASVEEAAGLPRLVAREALVDAPEASAFQPAFSPDGRFLAYVADPDGWWRLYARNLASGQARALSPKGVEAGVPAWVQGLRTFGFAPDGQIYYLQNRLGFWKLWSVAPDGGGARRHEALDEYTYLAQPSVSPGGELALLASSDVIPPRVIRYDPAAERVTVVKRSAGEHPSPGSLSRASPLSWESDGQVVHGLFYVPVHPRLRCKGKPPLVVLVHGGPTSQRHAAYDPLVQFFSTRGYAVLQVNYRGSTGCGRAYREALKGNWGAYDVEDCLNGARFLSRQGFVNPDKRVIMGGSAGGFTVLQALVHHPGFFKAGVCLFGVSNQFTLAADTHKFEAHYSDWLLGPLPAAARVYHERSPLFFAERIVDPVLLFQGAEDKVVPPEQSEAIVASLQARGVAHEYHLYAGEGHGWRKRETISDFYARLEAFLRRHVIFAA